MLKHIIALWPLRQRVESASTAREHVLQRCAEINAEESDGASADELEAVFGPDSWDFIEEISAELIAKRRWRGRA